MKRASTRTPARVQLRPGPTTDLLAPHAVVRPQGVPGLSGSGSLAKNNSTVFVIVA